jgi:hypothetical protein
MTRKFITRVLSGGVMDSNKWDIPISHHNILSGKSGKEERS